MRSIFSLTLFLALLFSANAQTKERAIYNPDADAKSEIKSAVNIAKQENKHVLIQVGGNWCPWCIKLHNFIHEDETLDSLIKTDYVYTLVNYSKENKNMEVMTDLDYPQRFGFPVLVILDREGNRIHTQNTAYLEKDKSYNEKKLKEFLLNWNVKALDRVSYNTNQRN